MKRETPESAYIRGEFYTKGCGACVNSVFNPRKRNWHCEREMDNYPDRSRDDCEWWMRKKR